MPLDPEMTVVLAVMGEIGILQSVAGCSAEEIRARFAPLEALRKERNPLVGEEDCVFPGPGGPVALRVYRPSKQANLPVIIYFHGGGFVLGGIDSHGHICRELALEADALVVSVDYRLAPEHDFPAAPEDGLASVRWIAENAEKLGGDSSRIALAGDSAGGNLAIVTAIRIRDEGGPVIRLVFAAYPGTDANADWPSRRDNAEGYFLTAEFIEWFYSYYLWDESNSVHPWASPIYTSSLAGLPPIFVITAEFDPLRDEAEHFVSQLELAGSRAWYSRYDGAIHGFLGPATTIGREALREAGDALREALQAP